MNYKYTLRDVLLEAGKAEYYSIPEDKEWQRSEKHRKGMNKLFDKQLPLIKRIGKTPLYRGIAIAAAAVVLLTGVTMAVKPLRDPVLSFISGIFSRGEDTETAENTSVTGPEETDPAVIVTDEQTTEPEETKQPDDTTENRQLNFSVTSGGVTIYPELYILYCDSYDGYGWIIAEGPGADAAETVPLIIYDKETGIYIDYDGTSDIDRVEFRVSYNGVTDAVAFDFMNEYFKSAAPGVYRFVVSFEVKGRNIDGKYEMTCYEYPFDVEVNFGDWDELDTQGRVERAVYEITHYGINYQRFRYLCGDEHADDVHYDGDYYLGDEPADNFTYGYFLDLYDTETEPMRKQLMFVYISSFLTDTWNDEERAVPYTTKYFPYFDRFKADNLPRFDASYNEECDKWIHYYYYNAFCQYAKNMTENEVKTKYAPSYKLIKKYGFDNFSDSSKTNKSKATRVINEFFNMALSVKYGIAVNDPSSNVYFRFDEGDGGGSIYEPGDAVYTALLKYYTKDELDRSDSAPAVSEQREGIKTIDKWKEYFTSLTTKSIADDFVKENKYFFTSEDGRVLTCNSYYFFNTNNLNTPSIYGNYESGKIYVNDVDESRYYTVELSEEDGKLKITGGTLVTEWLNRTLSPEECAIRDTVMDVEKLYHIISCGIVDDFKYYTFDKVYSIAYGNNKDLPVGLEEKLNETSVYEMPGKKRYVSDRVVYSSYGLDTYDHWIRYFSRILPEDLVKNYITETRYFLVVDGSVYLLPNALQSWLEIDYGTMKITGEENGIITVSAVINGTSAPDREVTFELERADNGYGYRIVGGTFIDLYISFPQYGSPANFIYTAIWSLSPTDKLVKYKDFYDADENDLPNGFAEKLNEYYGDTRSYYHYFIFADRDGNVIKSIDYYKNKAYEFYNADFVDDYFTDNKDYIEADGVLYVCENYVSFLMVDEVYSIEKLSDTKYKIEMRIIETGTAPGVPTWDCSAYVDIVNGSPVITGGTFLTDVLKK